MRSAKRRRHRSPHHWPPTLTTNGSHELNEWEEGQKEPNRRWTVREADPQNAEEAEGEQKRRMGAERHPEPPEAAERDGSLAAPSQEP